MFAKDRRLQTVDLMGRPLKSKTDDLFSLIKEFNKYELDEFVQDICVSEGLKNKSLRDKQIKLNTAI